MTTICMPRQLPRYGVLFVLAHFAAWIIPSVPLCPKPPGTKIPFAVQTACHALWNSAGFSVFAWSSRFEASTQMRFSFLPQRIALCSRDLMTDRYESWRLVYFPAKAMCTGSKRRSCCVVRLFHSVQVRCPRSNRAGGVGDGIEFEDFADCGDEALLFEQRATEERGRWRRRCGLQLLGRARLYTTWQFCQWCLSRAGYHSGMQSICISMNLPPRGSTYQVWD